MMESSAVVRHCVDWDSLSKALRNVGSTMHATLLGYCPMAWIGSRFLLRTNCRTAVEVRSVRTLAKRLSQQKHYRP
jgi:hypothetical protein